MYTSVSTPTVPLVQLKYIFTCKIVGGRKMTYKMATYKQFTVFREKEIMKSIKTLSVLMA